MRQFTMNIDDSLLQAAKLHAVTTGRTVSDIVRDLLAREVGWSGSGPLAPLDDVRAAPVLEAYSAGRISRRQAMQALDLDPERQPEVVEAMNRLGIPWPEIDRGQIDQEAEIVVQAILEAADEG
jgi:hypothetical protein